MLPYIPLTTSRLGNVHTLATQCDSLVLTSSLILLAEHADGKANRIINRAGGSIPVISAIMLSFSVVTFMADLSAVVSMTRNSTPAILFGSSSKLRICLLDQAGL